MTFQELQQHDVQELNRILFAAIESSLVGTRGEHLIGRLYHGTSVQQVSAVTLTLLASSTILTPSNNNVIYTKNGYSKWPVNG